MHSFAVLVVSYFRNLKGWSMMGRVLLTFLFTTIIERVSDSAPSSPWNLSAYWPWVATMPSKPVRKSTCQKARRNPASVTGCRPAASCIRTASRMQSSSIFPSCGDFSARAFFSAAGRRRLPTWSARKGGRMARAYSGNLPNGPGTKQTVKCSPKTRRQPHETPDRRYGRGSDPAGCGRRARVVHHRPVPQLSLFRRAAPRYVADPRPVRQNERQDNARHRRQDRKRGSPDRVGVVQLGGSGPRPGAAGARRDLALAQFVSCRRVRPHLFNWACD